MKGKLVNSIGIDLIELSKIQASQKRFGRHFLAKVLTKGEMAYCRKKKNFYQSVAVRFAAKEAFKKAVCQFWDKPIAWKEVEVRMGKNSAPELILSPRLAKFTGKKQISVSLSHTDKFAIAAVLISG